MEFETYPSHEELLIRPVLNSPSYNIILYILYENVYSPLFWIRPLSIGRNKQIKTRANKVLQYLILSLTSIVTVLFSGLSMSWRAKVPGDVRLVRIMLFLELPHHARNRSLEKPHCKSGTLDRTTYNKMLLMIWLVLDYS